MKYFQEPKQQDKRKTGRQEAGFSLVEMLVSSTLLMILMYAVFMMMEFHGEFTKTQQAGTRLQQESRYLLANFTSDVKNAGSILTLAHTGGFLSATPFFNGIYPINGNFSTGNDKYPDGIIVASGDPYGVTALSSSHVPSPGGTIPVKTTEVISPGVPWAQGDIGIIIGTDGYYVFSVDSVSETAITTRASGAVYYSGLLNSPTTRRGTQTGYIDNFGATPGNAINYQVNSPVIRLDNFGIYLIDERYDSRIKRTVRELIKVTDANGDESGNFLSDGTTAFKGVIVENIWDFQVSYTSYPNYPDHTVKNNYFKGAATGSLGNLLTDINTRSLKEITVNIVALSDEHAGKGTYNLQVPAIGDAQAYNLPTGKYSYRLFTISIDPRNYNITI